MRSSIPYWIRVGPNLMTGMFIRREKFGRRHIDIQGECHVMVEGKTGVMYP